MVSAEAVVLAVNLVAARAAEVCSIAAVAGAAAPEVEEAVRVVVSIDDAVPTAGDTGPAPIRVAHPCTAPAFGREGLVGEVPGCMDRTVVVAAVAREVAVGTVLAAVAVAVAVAADAVADVVVVAAAGDRLYSHWVPGWEGDDQDSSQAGGSCLHCGNPAASPPAGACAGEDDSPSPHSQAAGRWMALPAWGYTPTCEEACGIVLVAAASTLQSPPRPPLRHRIRRHRACH
jgi:hypothetical protein